MIGVLSDWLRHIARRRRWSADQATGRRAEDLAHRFLRRRGYTIVARNYRTPSGDAEADLIAWEKDALVIVEVKSRASEEYGPPERAIDDEKRAHLVRAARHYARKSETSWELVRFDLVTVVFAKRPEIKLYKTAFQRP